MPAGEEEFRHDDRGLAGASHQRRECEGAGPTTTTPRTIRVARPRSISRTDVSRCRRCASRPTRRGRDDRRDRRHQRVPPLSRCTSPRPNLPLHAARGCGHAVEVLDGHHPTVEPAENLRSKAVGALRGEPVKRLVGTDFTVRSNPSDSDGAREGCLALEFAHVPATIELNQPLTSRPAIGMRRFRVAQACRLRRSHHVVDTLGHPITAIARDPRRVSTTRCRAPRARQRRRDGFLDRRTTSSRSG